jgi:hypothetical protein
MGRVRRTYGEQRNAYSLWWDGEMDRDHWEDIDVGGIVILKMILEK